MRHDFDLSRQQRRNFIRREHGGLQSLHVTSYCMRDENLRAELGSQPGRVIGSTLEELVDEKKWWGPNVEPACLS